MIRPPTARKPLTRFGATCRARSLAACSDRPRCQLTIPQPNAKNYSASEAPDPGGIISDIISECPADFVGIRRNAAT